MGGAKWAKGKFKDGIELDKSGFIEWQHHADFNFKESLTIMIHARIDAIVPQEWVGIPRKEGEYVMAAHKVGDKMEMTFWINIGGWIGQIPAAGQYPAHKFGEWHHYAVTYDGKEVLLYLDGKDAGGQKVSGQMSQTGAVLVRIGRLLTEFSLLPNGTCDFRRIPLSSFRKIPDWFMLCSLFGLPAVFPCVFARPNLHLSNLVLLLACKCLI